MGNITPTDINALTDKLVAGWEAVLGTSASGLGCGDGTFGFSKKVADLQGIVSGATVSALADVGVESILVPLAVGYPGGSTAAKVYASNLGTMFGGLDQLSKTQLAALSQVIGTQPLDQLMLWNNFGNGTTYWQNLAHPDWRGAYFAVKGAYPSALNCYFAIQQGGTYGGTTFTNGLAKFVVGTGLTAGNSADTTKYAGGFAYATWSGVTGSGLLTVVGLDQNGAAETWTGTVTGASSAGLALTPTNRAYSLISSVTSITVAAGVSAGTLYIEARPPAGRSNPPS